MTWDDIEDLLGRDGIPDTEDVVELIDRRNEFMSLAHKIDVKIAAIQKKCPHDNVDKSEDYEIEIASSYDDDSCSEIRERRITCNDCNHTWHEQRYAYEENFPYDLGERG